MADALSPCKSIRGRPRRKLTDVERKHSAKISQDRYQRKRIYIGAEGDRWAALKAKLHLQSHELMAKVLLDRFVFNVPSNYHETLSLTS
jgi:hypothetical protein